MSSKCAKKIDWEQRRYELAKAAMQGSANMEMNKEDIALLCIVQADEMIKQLKESEERK